MLTHTSRADRAGRGVLARVRAGAPECQTGERAGQRQRVRAAGQLWRGQTSGPRRPRVHAVWHARLHGPRGGHVQGPRAGGRPLEPGRRAVRDGGWQTAVRRGRRRRSVRECCPRPVPGARVLQPAPAQPDPRPGTGERGEGGKIRGRDRCPCVVFHRDPQGEGAERKNRFHSRIPRRPGPKRIRLLRGMGMDSEHSTSSFLLVFSHVNNMDNAK